MHKYLLVGLLLAASGASAQSVPFNKKDFANDKEGFKTAVQEIKLGDDLYDLDPPQYEGALTHYLAAQKFNPNNDQLNIKIGDCYLHSGYKTRALAYLRKAFQLNADADPRIHYLLGQGLHLNARWSEAIAEYKKSLAAGEIRTDEGAYKALLKRIQECENGRQMMANPVRAFIDNAGPGVNSPYPEYGPVISADESVILFTSRRAGSTGEKASDTGGFYEDVYQSTRDGQQESWSAAANLGTNVNTPGHDATVGLSPDGQHLLVYVEDNGGDLRQADLRGTEWRKPQDLGSRVNTKYHESSAAYTPDGRSLYFVSDKPGGQGSRDIYKINLEGREPAQNLGPVINTPYGEEGVFLHPDGKTMYFSSEGHNSMGGYDIFKSVFENGQWSKPENLGWPINTPDDDVFFVISASGRHGYYSSFRDGGLGAKDIYQITFLGPEKPPLLSQEDQLLASRAQPVKETLLAPPVAIVAAQVTIMKGVVTEEASRQPLEATIDVIDNNLNQVIASFQSNEKSGRYLVSLPSGVNYGIVVRKDGYLFHSENFDLPAGAAYSEIVKDVALKKLDVGAKVVLNNIFFDFDKSTLRQESTGELQRLQKLLTETPALRLEISGHSDNVGSDVYNKDLSQRRAQAVVNYLVTQGIDKGRLTSVGYGDSQPVAPNTTKAGRQLNRRTEFKVTGK